MPQKQSKKKSRQKMKTRHNQRNKNNGGNPQVIEEGSEIIAESSNPKLIESGGDEAPNSAISRHLASSGSSQSQYNWKCSGFCTNQNVKITPEAMCWWNYSEEQLEALLTTKLEEAYREVYARLLSYGYSPATAVGAIRCTGHGFGNFDIVTNIFQNCVNYIEVGTDFDMDEGQDLSANMELLVNSSLDMLVFFVCQVREKLGRREAMWCLVMTKCHLGKACSIRVPLLYEDANEEESFNFTEAYSNACKYNDDQSFSDRAMYGFHKTAPLVLEPSGGDNVYQDSAILKMVRGRLETLNLDEEQKKKPPDRQNELISSLMNEVREIKKQPKEGNESAQKRVTEATKRLCNGHKELQFFRGERARKPWRKTKAEIQAAKRLMEKENDLRNLVRETDNAKETLKKLEKETAETRAELEAVKLGMEETHEMCINVEKRERRSLRKITALSKQYNKLLVEVEGVRTKHFQLELETGDFKKAQEEAEGKLREEMASKEFAITQRQEERRLYKEAEANFEKQKEALYQKKELEFQKLKEDKRRLEAEISHLIASMESSDGNMSTRKDPAQLMLPSVDVFYTDLYEDASPDRLCSICMIREASVVFLPCAHQVMCGNCNGIHCMNVEGRCPSCQTLILERVHVYGASSQV